MEWTVDIWLNLPFDKKRRSRRDGGEREWTHVRTKAKMGFETMVRGITNIAIQTTKP